MKAKHEQNPLEIISMLGYRIAMAKSAFSDLKKDFSSTIFMDEYARKLERVSLMYVHVKNKQWK